MDELQTQTAPETQVQDNVNIESTPATVTDSVPSTETPSNPLAEKLKSIYSDKDFSDESSLTQAALDYLNELEPFKEKYNKTMEVNDNVVKLLESDETMRNILVDMLNGMPSGAAFVKHINPEELQSYMNGEFTDEQLIKAKEERLSKYEQKKQMEQQFAENQKKSQEALLKFQEENNMTDEEVVQFIDKVDDVISQILQGSVPPEFLSTMMKGFSFENNIQAAQKAAEIKGKNSQIEEKRTKTIGDGMPNLGGSKVAEKPKTTSDLPEGINEFLGSIGKYNNQHFSTNRK